MLHYTYKPAYINNREIHSSTRTDHLIQLKKKDLKNYSQPTIIKQVFAFLGLAGHYRRFIPNFFFLGFPP